MKKYSGLLGLCMGLSLTLASWSALAQFDISAASEGEVSDSGEESSSANTDRRLYVSPMASYISPDSDRKQKDGYGGTVSVGKRMTSGLNLELTGFYSTADLDLPGSPLNGEAQKLTGVGAAAMVFPSQTLPNLYAILALHQGYGEFETPSVTLNYTTTVFDSGLGYLFPLTDTLGFDVFLRTEARYRMDNHNRKAVGGEKSSYDLVANIGLLIPLGKLPVEAPAEVEVVAAADADGDGIPDDKDTCPDTPAGTAVNETGCEGDTDGDGVLDRLDTCPDTPAGTAVNETGCVAVADADGDGVPDDKDTCPSTPAGTAVNETGCVGDADGDGIPDDKDTCPDTPAGTSVGETGCAPEPGCRPPKPGEPINLEGCATGESVVLKGVNFEVNKDRLTANAKVILNTVSDALVSSSTLKVEVGGHTDSQGGDAFNQKLSEARANSVKAYLVKRGIDGGRITVKGYGETQPVDTNETAEGRENNRRVELKVLDQ